MRFIRVSEIISLHSRIIDTSGGAHGVRDLGALKSALGQPHQTFGGQELYSSLIEKVAVLCHSLVLNHPFVDGNKRIGHAAMAVVLLMNGYELEADIDEQESLFLDLASGNVSRSELTEWVQSHAKLSRGDA